MIRASAICLVASVWCAGFGQEKAASPAPLAFEVVSVKKLAEMPFRFSPERSGDRLHWTNNLMGLIMWSYQREAYEISFLPTAAPKEFPASFYEINAKMPADTTQDQLREMVRTMLAERFKFTAHHETRDLPGYALTVAKGGLKIEAVKPGDPPPHLPEWFGSRGSIKAFIEQMEGMILATMEGNGITALTARRVSMDQVAKELSRQLRAFVMDDTGVPGQFYFGIKYAQIDSNYDVDAASVFGALQTELGLKLEKRKGPVDVMVVNHVLRVPTEN
jgi:uncharacterized protein (TIGR03435 family)